MPHEDLKPAARSFFARPQQPTLFRELPHEPEIFDSLEALALRIHELRRGAGLDLRNSSCKMAGFATFPAVQIYLTPKGGDPDWLGAAAIQDHDIAALKAALQATRPRKAA